MKKIKELWLKSNEWYGSLKEPLRFLIFFIPFCFFWFLTVFVDMRWFIVIALAVFPRFWFVLKRDFPCEK